MKSKAFNHQISGLAMALTILTSPCVFSAGASDVISDVEVGKNQAEGITSVGGGKMGLSGIGSKIVGGELEFGASESRTTVNSILSIGGNKVKNAKVLENHAADVINAGTELTVNSVVAR